MTVCHPYHKSGVNLYLFGYMYNVDTRSGFYSVFYP